MLNTIFGENLAHSVLIRIGQENLSKVVIAHHFEKLGYAIFIQFVEDVVQQEDGFDLLTCAGIVELGEAQGQREGFLLALGAEAPDRLSVDKEQVIVLMNPEIGESAVQVGLCRLLQTFRVLGGLQTRAVLDGDHLRAPRQLLIMLLEHGKHIFNERLPAGEDLMAQRDHLLVQNPKQLHISAMVLQHLLEEGVTLHQQFTVGDEMLKILCIELRDNGVEETAPRVAHLVDNVAVVRRNHHGGKESDMGAEAGVLLLVGPHRLMPIPVGAAHLRVVLRLALHKLTMYGKEVGVETHGIDILGGEIALAEREIIYRVQQVGLAAAVPANDGVDILIKREFSLFVAFEVRKFQVLEIHGGLELRVEGLELRASVWDVF